jgi:hypothetical protein
MLIASLIEIPLNSVCPSLNRVIDCSPGPKRLATVSTQLSVKHLETITPTMSLTVSSTISHPDIRVKHGPYELLLSLLSPSVQTYPLAEQRLAVRLSFVKWYSKQFVVYY